MQPISTSRPASRWTLPVLMAGTFMIVLDFFIVNVALPSMQRSLHANAAALEWVVAGYGLTFSTMLITAGRIGDRIGRRRTLAIGLALFTVASAGCGLAPSAGVLVAFRLLQGLGAAGISPSVLAVIGVTYEGADRARAIGVYGTTMGVAAAGGQLIGGLLIQANPAGLGWRGVFLINLPVAAVALAALRRHVPESMADGARMPRWTSVGLITAGLVAVVLPLVQGRQYGWPWWSIACLGVAPVLLAAFAVSQLRDGRAGRPVLMDMTMFKERPFASGLITQVGLWCGQASFFLVLALYLQLGRRLSAMSAGLVFTVLAASYLYGSMRAGALTARFGRSVITAGAAVLAGGHLALLAAVAAVGTGGSVGALVPGLLLIGLGMGLCIAPLTTVVLSACDPSRAGAASGALSTVQQVGNSLGVAVVGVIFFGATGRGYAHALELSLAALAGLLAVVAGLSRLLPAGSGRQAAGREETLVRLGQMAGSVVSGVETSDPWTAHVRLPGWRVTVADVAATAVGDLQRLAASGCRMADCGRYGRFWWLRFLGDDGTGVMVLGSGVGLFPVAGDPRPGSSERLESGDLVS